MKLKKTVAMLLVALIAAFALVSCGAPAASESPSGDAQESAAASGDAQESAATGEQTADTEGKKIGVIFYSKDDALGAAVYSTLNYAAEALGIEIQWDLGKLDPTAQITAAENLIASGCDGILCIPLSEVVTQKVAQLCQESGVYFQICFRTITDEAIKTEVEGYEYYLGECVEDEVNAAKHMVELMAEAGKKNACVNYVSPGSALRLRNDGIDQGMEEYGINKLAEYTIPDNSDLNALTATIQNYVNSYPDCDVILASSASVGQGEVIINTLNSMAPNGKIQLASFDVWDGMAEAFESGSLGCAVGGMSPDALFSFMVLYNAVIGQRMSDEQVALKQNYIFVTSAEDCAIYEQYIDNPDYMIYTAEEIQQMSRAINPDFSMEDMEQIMADYTLENIIEKIDSRGDAA